MSLYEIIGSGMRSMKLRYHKVLNHMSKFETIFHQHNERKKEELTSVMHQMKMSP